MHYQSPLDFPLDVDPGAYRGSLAGDACRVAEAVREMDSDDVVDLVEDLDAPGREQILAQSDRNRARMREACERGFLTATDLADWLVKELGLPFRDAHHVTGTLVKRAEGQGKGLSDLSLAEMQELAAGPHLTAHGYVSVPEQSLRSPDRLDKLVSLLLQLRGRMSWPAPEDEGGA